MIDPSSFCIFRDEKGLKWLFWPEKVPKWSFGPDLERFAKDTHVIPCWKAFFTLKLNKITIYLNFHNSAIFRPEKGL